MPAATFEQRQKYFDKNDIQLVSTPHNLVDSIWEDRPLKPSEPVWNLEFKYSGSFALRKYEQIGCRMGDNQMMLVTALDDIAWILNLRGNDISFNPLFFSYLIVHKEGKCDLFIDQAKISSPELKEYLDSIKVTLYNYDEIESKLTQYAATKPRISVDKN